MNNETQARNLYGICQWSMPEMDPDTATQTLIRLGLDGIELDSGNWNGAQLQLADQGLQKQWLDACRKHSLQIPALGVNSLCGDGMSKPEKKESVRKILANGVEIANSMNIPVLQLPSFFDGAIQTDLDLETTAERLQEVCGLAKPYGITIGTENALTVENCARLITLVDRENLKVFFDTQNPWAMEKMNVPEVLQGEYPCLYGDAVHIKDGRGESLSSALLGTGDSGFSETMAVFIEHGYTGWLILENDYNGIPDTTNWDSNVKADLSTLKKLMG